MGLKCTLCELVTKDWLIVSQRLNDAKPWLLCAECIETYGKAN